MKYNRIPSICTTTFFSSSIKFEWILTYYYLLLCSTTLYSKKNLKINGSLIWIPVKKSKTPETLTDLMNILQLQKRISDKVQYFISHDFLPSMTAIRSSPLKLTRNQSLKNCTKMHANVNCQSTCSFLLASDQSCIQFPYQQITSLPDET